MSGVAEAGLVLGLVSSIIAIYETAYETYEAAGDAQGLPKKLRAAADQIPLVCHTLTLARQNLQAGSVSIQSLQSARPVLEKCQSDAATLRDLFDKTIPAQDASKPERIRKAVSLQAKSGKIKAQMEAAMQALTLLGQHQLFSDAAVLEDIKVALEQLDRIPDEEGTARYSHSGGGDISVSRVSGDQNNYKSSGSMYNADKMYFGQNQGLTPPASEKFNGVYAYGGLTPVYTYIHRPELERRLYAHLTHLTHLGKQNVLRGGKTAVVWGLGGSGKSQLTLQYIQTHRSRYQAVFWVAAGRKDTVERDFVHIHSQLYPDLSRNRTPTAEEAVVGVKSWLQQQDRCCLWVMDSADDIEDATGQSYVHLDHYLPQAPQLDRIITTRVSSIQNLGSTGGSIEVKEMQETEATALFQQCAELRNPSISIAEEVVAIVQELGCLALAVTLAGTYVKETPRLSGSLHLYLLEYRAHRKRLLSRHPQATVHRYTASVLSTWEMSLTSVVQRSSVAGRLFSLLAFLHFDDIFPGLISPIVSRVEDSTVLREIRCTSWTSLLSPEGDTLDEYMVEEGLRTLRAYSLLWWRSEQGAYGMHKLVHAWGQDRLNVLEQKQWSRAGLDLLSTVIDAGDKSLAVSTRLMPHMIANFTTLQNTYRSMDGARDINRNSLRTVADLVIRSGRWNELYEIQVFIRKITEAVLGKQHPDTLASMGNLVVILIQQGQYQAAESLHRQTLELQKIVLGKQHPHTLASMGNLAVILSKQGQYQAAESLYRQILELQKIVLSEQHRDTLASMNNLALILSEQEKYRAAESLHRQTLELQKIVLSEQHPDTLASMNNLAFVLGEQGQYQAAELLYRQTLELRKIVLGKQHPYTLTSINNLALILSKQGQYQAAELLYRQALKLRKTVLGEQHPDVSQSANQLIWVLREQGKHEEADKIEGAR